MSYEYSENILVQNSAGNVLHDKLGWDVVYAYNEEKLGLNGTLGRESYKEVLLTRYIKQALFELNDWMTDEYALKAIDKLIGYMASSSTLQINQDKYFMLIEGIEIETTDNRGNKATKKARIIDYEHPENNRFLAVKEMKIYGELYHRRADIIGYVNGIPLLFVELKKHNVDVENAYNDNYRDYQQTIPQLFRYNAFVMLSNGLDARVGTLGSKYVFFHEWKRLAEGQVGAVDLETMLLGICKKENFIDLFENFILFDKSNGTTAKIMARNHQYLGVNAAFEAYKQRKEKNGKLGVFWHTQGSGKSYSMVFLTEKIRRKLMGSPTFLLLTDRNELNKQLSGTFEACGCLQGVPAKRYIASSGEDLIGKLQGNPSYIFSLIQKFNDKISAPIIPNHDILIISDEAHRSQYGKCAENMDRLLPEASKIGFTGTPLFKYDNITARTFANDTGNPYISVYDFDTAVKDGATVPLYYENRGDKLAIENPAITEKLIEAIDDVDLDDNQKAKLENDMAREIHILTSEKRLKAIAKDFVDHYSDLWTTGKAMFVAIDKVTAVRMCNYAKEFWQEKVLQLQHEASTVTDQQAAQELDHKIKWMQETEMEVVISQEQNEIDTFKHWGIDIIPIRQKIVAREMEREFKDEDNTFRVVFVCAMWLTGFDVKCLANLYLDKPMKAHTLMQAIARANRVNEGKTNGLIIDYVGIVRALRKALAEYTVLPGGKPGDILPEKSKLLARVKELIFKIDKHIAQGGYQIAQLFAVKDFAKQALLRDIASSVCVTAANRKTFEIMARELFKLWKYIESTEKTPEDKRYKEAIDEIYGLLQEKRKSADITGIMVELQQIVDKNIQVKETDKQLNKIDLSGIDFSRLAQEFSKHKTNHLMLKDLTEVINNRLRRMLAQNPTRINYYKKYQEIIDEYNESQDKTKIEAAFEELTNLVKEMSVEEERYVREGFENDEQLAIYDQLIKPDLTPQDIKRIKKVSVELLGKIKAKIASMDHWRDKTTTKDTIRLLIRDDLYNSDIGLPETYSSDEAVVYTSRLYEYVYNAYPEVSMGQMGGMQ